MTEEELIYRFGYKQTKSIVLMKGLSGEDLDGLSGKRMSVLFHIAQCLDKDGNYTSDFYNRVVGAKAKVNPKTVSIYIGDLVDSGFLIKNTRFHHYYALNGNKIKVK